VTLGAAVVENRRYIFGKGHLAIGWSAGSDSDGKHRTKRDREQPHRPKLISHRNPPGQISNAKILKSPEDIWAHKRSVESNRRASTGS
jgi:hypothetical protein